MLEFSKDHEWIKMEGNVALVGISNHAQEALGEIVYVELPEVGDSFEAGEEIANIESVKAASAILTPAGGTVCEVNTDLESSPELVNKDPYGAWIYKLSDVKKADDLLSEAEYEKFVKEEDK